MQSVLTFQHVHICSLTAGHGWHFRVSSACQGLITQPKQKLTAECHEIGAEELKEDSGLFHSSGCLMRLLCWHRVDGSADSSPARPDSETSFISQDCWTLHPVTTSLYSLCAGCHLILPPCWLNDRCKTGCTAAFSCFCPQKSGFTACTSFCYFSDFIDRSGWRVEGGKDPWVFRTGLKTRCTRSTGWAIRTPRYFYILSLNSHDLLNVNFFCASPW